jgi:hypothetical protein
MAPPTSRRTNGFELRRCCEGPDDPALAACLDGAPPQTSGSSDARVLVRRGESRTRTKAAHPDDGRYEFVRGIHNFRSGTSREHSPVQRRLVRLEATANRATARSIASLRTRVASHTSWNSDACRGHRYRASERLLARAVPPQPALLLRSETRPGHEDTDTAARRRGADQPDAPPVFVGARLHAGSIGATGSTTGQCELARTQQVVNARRLL